MVVKQQEFMKSVFTDSRTCHSPAISKRRGIYVLGKIEDVVLKIEKKRLNLEV